MRRLWLRGPMAQNSTGGHSRSRKWRSSAGTVARVETPVCCVALLDRRTRRTRTMWKWRERFAVLRVQVTVLAPAGQLQDVAARPTVGHVVGGRVELDVHFLARPEDRQRVVARSHEGFDGSERRVKPFLMPSIRQRRAAVVVVV